MNENEYGSTHKTHENAPKNTEHKTHTKTKEKVEPVIWRNAAAVLAVLLVISLFGNYNFDVSLTKEGTSVAAAPTAAPPSAGAAIAAPSAAALPIDSTYDSDDHIKGDPNAPVTIVEFSDYECPFCERFYSQTYSQIVEQYVDTGKAKIILRDFPLSFHSQAQKAAEAAECAGEQERYYEMHDLLFERGVAGGVNSFKQMASDLGLDTSAFNTCLDTNAMASEVQADFADGQRLGIQGTPGFLVNGKLISGAQPFSVFAQAINAQLS
jgi:protein-disulfide isomerase